MRYTRPVARSDDRRWLIVVVNVAAGFLVLGRSRGGWATGSLGVLGPYVLWAGLVVLAGWVALAWTDPTDTEDR